jgi:hypothetical protein
MIDKMSDEQLIMISPVFDVKYWTKRFKERPADTALVLEILKECNIS